MAPGAECTLPGVACKQQERSNRNEEDDASGAMVLQFSADNEQGHDDQTADRLHSGLAAPTAKKKIRSFHRTLSDIPELPARVLDHYYFWYVTYLLACMLLGAAAMPLLGGKAPFVDCLFLAVSAASMTGLSTNDFTAQPCTTHVITWLLIILANPMLLSLVPVCIRWYYSKSRAYKRSTAFFGIDTQETDERIALEMIMLAVSLYWLTSITLGWLCLWWSLREYPDGGPWPALFLSVSAFHNAGLVSMPNGLPFKQHYGPITLTIVMLLILGGNTCFPMLVRCMLQALHRLAVDPDRERVLELLLKHPRTCYTHLFPAYANRWLCIVTPGLVAVQIFVLAITDLVAEPSNRSRTTALALDGLNGWQTTWAILFQSVSTRTAGFSVCNLSLLSPTTAFVFCVCMWISVSPVVVVMRTTTVSLKGTDETFVNELEWSQRRKEERQEEASVVKQQLTTFMSENSALLLCLFFSILFAEEYHTSNEFVRDRRFLFIVFEFCSAYGTVGLSMSSKAASVCGDWCWESKIFLIVVMFLGRLRGLPESIDPTFKLVDPAEPAARQLPSASAGAQEDQYLNAASESSDGGSSGDDSSS